MFFDAALFLKKLCRWTIALTIISAVSGSNNNGFLKHLKTIPNAF